MDFEFPEQVKEVPEVCHCLSYVFALLIAAHPKFEKDPQPAIFAQTNFSGLTESKEYPPRRENTVMHMSRVWLHAFYRTCTTVDRVIQASLRFCHHLFI